MKILILTADSNGGYPVPATRGGAVATLIEHLIKGNDKMQLCKMEVLTLYDREAYDIAKQYSNISFRWVKVSKLVHFIDKVVFDIIRKIKKNEKAVSFKSPFALLYYIWIARRIIKYTDADKIIVENNIPLALAFKRNTYKGEIYYHLHNVPRINAKCLDVMDDVTRFLCVSKFVANSICSENSCIGKIPKEKAHILFNCVDTSLFRPIEKDNKLIENIKAKYNIKDSDFVIIFTGRLTEEKGPDKLLAALEQLPLHVKAMIIGSFHYNSDVKSDFQNNLHSMSEKLGERVIFTGYVDQKILPYYYNIANVAVLPSMWDEPAGLTNLEAMACGIPVITTDSGGIPEYVGQSIIIKRNDDIVTNIVENIKKLMSSELQQKKLSNYGIEFVKKNFDSKNYMKHMIELITD